MRRYGWLILALVLLVLASYLMRAGEKLKLGANDERQVNFPRFATPAEYERSSKRRTLLTMRETSATEPKVVEKRDPLLAVLPANAPFGVVIEANAIRNSPIGEMLLACTGTAGADKIAELKKETGFDPLTDLDRVAVVGESVMMTGNFGGLDRANMEKELGAPTTYGDKARIYKNDNEAVAVWNDEMMLAAKTSEELQHSIDVLEGRKPPPESPTISENMAYGEAYGKLSVELLTRMLPEEDGLKDKVREAIEGVELHATTFGDVALVAKLDGSDSEKVEELARSLGGALALFRLQAKKEGGKEGEDLAELLDLARIERQGSGTFSVELALPLSYVKKKLGPCADKVVLPD
ncbi:MAG: hypothetical protein HY791_19220 [Deltaproteobacteria bacterium]|nr:hypothetical protein [Deltaproteobacteria bacterium]